MRRLVLASLISILPMGQSCDTQAPPIDDATQDSQYLRGPNLDTVVVFVHGVFGGSIGTWTNPQTKAYWPQLLLKDDAFNSTDVYVYSYPTPFRGETYTLDELSDNMRLVLENDNIFQKHKNVIFVCHSMGGLVVRGFVKRYYQAYAPRVQLIAFYSTPTTGADIAQLGRFLSDNPQINRMLPAHSGDYLSVLLKDWRQLPHVNSYCAYETKKTYGIRIVDPQSASALCDAPVDPINRNHIDIVKPANSKDIAYVSFRQAFLKRVGELPSITIPLTGSPGLEQDPAFSSDGKFLVYVWDGGNHGTRSIYLTTVESKKVIPLTDEHDGNVQSPIWSYDEARIFYARPVGDKQEIWEVPRLGGPRRKLGETSLYPDLLHHHAGLSASPDGMYIAVPSGGSPGREEQPGIFLFSLNDSKWRRLTTADFGDNQPSFSPDGQDIVFVRSSSLGVEDLYVVPSVGGEPRQLTSDAKPISGVAWTPDGREVIFASNRRGNFGLWRVSRSGGEPTSAEITGDFLASPSLSRQGNRLAYVQDSPKTSIWKLAILPGGKVHETPVKLVYSSREEDSPQFSPDGKNIVYVSTRTGSTEIWTCEKDGTNQIRLTTINGPITGTPRWSPDGKQIVFDSRSRGQSRIYVMEANGTHMQAVTGGPGEDTVPSWSKDGAWIFFSSNRSGKNEIWKIAVSGGKPVRLTQQGGFAPLPSPDGRFVYYAKGTVTPGIWRIPVGGGAERRVMGDLQIGFWGQWAVNEAGIYFISAGSDERIGIQFFSFVTRKTEHIFTLEKDPTLWTDGLAVSPDGRAILYTQTDPQSNIIVVKNFH